MSRPKGSKNKKTLMKESGLGSQISEKKAAAAELEKQQEAILSAIASSQEKLKEVKKNLKSLNRDIAKLEAKQLEAETAASVAAKAKELHATIDKLIAEGGSVDEIMEKLK